MTTADEIRRALAHPNARAFLRVIREGESNQSDDAYSLTNGGGRFSSFAAHPFAGMRAPPGRASGAYQFIPSTWADVARRYPDECADFSPAAQDFGAVVKLADRGALGDVLAGRFDAAVAKLRQEWTSLPGAAENSGRYTLAKARAVFEAWGGVVAGSTRPTDQPAAPIDDRSVPYVPPAQDSGRIFNPETEAPNMIAAIPITLAILQSLVPMLPTLGKLLGGGSEKTAARVEAAGMLASAAADVITKTVPNALNLQDAAERIQADPQIAKATDEALAREYMRLTEIGGGVDAARKYNLEAAASRVPFWRQPAFVVTALLFPIVYMVSLGVLFAQAGIMLIAAAFGASAELVRMLGDAVSFSQDMKNVVITAIVSGVLMGIMAFWLGTSYGSQRRGDPSNGTG